MSSERETMLIDELKATRAAHSTGEITVDFTADELDQIIAAMEVVEKLPRTADGVAVVPGMDLYTRNYNDIIKVAMPTSAWGQEPQEGRTSGLYWTPRRCFSTEAAARAAQEGK